MQATEALEFADYLARAWLSVEVWDADSLLFLGPLGLRQGARGVSRALEAVDVIDYQAQDG